MRTDPILFHEHGVYGLYWDIGISIWSAYAADAVTAILQGVPRFLVYILPYDYICILYRCTQLN